MNGILITQKGSLGAIVSDTRPVEFFERLGNMAMDWQRVEVEGRPGDNVWIDTGDDVVQALVMDELEVAP